MRRLIVNICDDMTDAAALAIVLRVVEGGRISHGGRYCLCTVGAGGLAVYADKTKTGNDVFSVLKEASHR
jgi:hypothetical protein